MLLEAKGERDAAADAWDRAADAWTAFGVEHQADVARRGAERCRVP
jgi:hypothetical protein